VAAEDDILHAVEQQGFRRHAVAPGAGEVTPGTGAGVPAWQPPQASGSLASSIGDQRLLRRKAPWNALDLGSTYIGGWIVVGATAVLTLVAWIAGIARWVS